MVVDRSMVWVLYALCCLPGVAWALRARWRSYYDEHERWRDAPWALVGTCVDAVLTGVGIGLCVAVAVLIVAVMSKRLTS